MKKHIFIWTIVGIASFLMLGLLYNNERTEDGEVTGSFRNTDQLDMEIERLGQNEYQAEEFRRMELVIEGKHSNNLIDNSRKNDLLVTLQHQKDRALILSISNWFKHCGGESIHNLYKEAKLVTRPSKQLIQEINVINQFRFAKTFQGKLNTFLHGEYSTDKAHSLIANFQTAIHGKRFRNCNEIKQLESNINQEINNFERFVGNFKIEILRDKSFNYYLVRNPSKMIELKKYLHYYQIFQDLKQAEELNVQNN